MLNARIAALVSTLGLIIVVGTVFFRYVESWSWIDSYFYAVVTLSTVGYGNLVPATSLGKIGTTVFIFLGLGVFAGVIQQITAYTMASPAERAAQRRLLRMQRAKRRQAEPPDRAQSDTDR